MHVDPNCWLILLPLALVLLRFVYLPEGHPWQQRWTEVLAVEEQLLVDRFGLARREVGSLQRSGQAAIHVGAWALATTSLLSFQAFLAY